MFHSCYNGTNRQGVAEMQEQSKHLSVKQWHDLAKSGIKIPMRTQLDGVSMQPLIRRNRDYVTIVYPERWLVRGDIVLFIDRRGKYVVHRIYRMDNERVQTFGDNCDHPDAWMPYGNILGLVTQVERGKKMYALDTDASRKWGDFWMKIFPLRRPFRKLFRFVRRVLSYIKRKIF